MLVWWVARSARFLYEAPQESAKRLATLPLEWEANMRANHQHYLHLAETLL